MFFTSHSTADERNAVMLHTFMSQDGIPSSEADIMATLQSPEVLEVRNYVLGPGLTSNIPQAAKLWADRFGIADKATFVTGNTPDEYLLEALQIKEMGLVALYWTCAVFGREGQLFFGKGMQSMMFFVQQAMPLDSMQLVMRDALFSPELAEKIVQTETVPSHVITIATHQAPRPLIEGLLSKNRHLRWIEATSNGAAAQMCLSGQCSLAITTEAARLQHNLPRVHNFGSPTMIFFGGLPFNSARVVKAAWQTVQHSAAAV